MQDKNESRNPSGEKDKDVSLNKNSSIPGKPNGNDEGMFVDESEDAGLPSDAGQQEAGHLSLQQLMWRRYLRNRLAVGSSILLIILYLLALFADFLAPYDYQIKFDNNILKVPQIPQFIDNEGVFHLSPFVYGSEATLDKKTFKYTYVTDYSKRYPLRLFVKGYPYHLLFLFPTDIHLFGVDEPATIFLFGTDAVGRDLFSRVLAGSRVSLTMGLVGVVLTIFFGSSIGTLSGYYGGLVDMVTQRIIEVLMSFPTIPLWAAFAAALPNDWSPINRYFAISVILSLVGWMGLARQVRAKVLSYREMDFAQAARAVGASAPRIIFVHMLPNAFSHIIVVSTLSIPLMILTETSLSFLGLGILPPATSWGALLRDAQDVTVILQQPWLMIPSVFVVVAVLAFNFVGDGLRDAADPFSI